MKDRSVIDDRYRSLLQKAVRRGQAELVFLIGALLDKEGGAAAAGWIERRSALIIFEECWPLAQQLHFTKGFHSKLAPLARAARSPKIRDASGLGFLAYALSRGETSVLDETAADRPIQAVAMGLKDPQAFWFRIAARPAAQGPGNLLAHARRHQEGGRPHDTAVLLAAAYLCATAAAPPELPAAEASELLFPFWVAFDRHTAEGARVLRDVSRDLHIPLRQLEWIQYYFEGSLANAEIRSPWWPRYCKWQLDRIGLTPDEAELIWEPAKVQIAEGLAEEAHRLQSDLYRWKLANIDRVESLKRQAEIFSAHLAEVTGGQSPLF